MHRQAKYALLIALAFSLANLAPSHGRQKITPFQPPIAVGSNVPGKAILISPSGTIATSTPTYTWNAVPLATWYYLWVNDSANASGKITQWYTAAQVGCPTGTGRCSLTPSTVLAPGNGQWWVQTWNNCGYGPWSDGRAFSVTVWPMFGHDPSHTRRSPYKGPSSPNHILQVQTGGSVYSSPAIGPDGRIYVGSSDKVHAVKTVYSADGAAALVLDWVYPTASSVYSSPALGPDGTVYVGSYNGKVHALNGATGSKRWEYTTGNGVDSSPAIGSDGTVYVGSYDGKVYALNGATGAKVWDYQTGGEVESSPAIGSDGTVYVGSYDGKLYALDGATGAKRWEYQAGGYVRSSPAIASDGTIYFGSLNGKVQALNATTGSKRWEYQTGFPVSSSPAIGSDGTLYFGAFNGKLYAVNGTTGVKLWEYQTGGGLPTTYIHSSPAIAANGTLYVGSSDRRLYAFLILD